MTGPEHYAEAGRLLTLADRHSSGATYGQEWTLTLTAAQVHATLALAAATAVGTAGPDGHAWADVAATKLSASKPETPSAGRPGSGPVSRRPPPLFPEPGPPRQAEEAIKVPVTHRDDRECRGRKIAAVRYADGDDGGVG